MGNAQKVYADENATQDQVDAAIKQLEEAQQTLVKKADTTCLLYTSPFSPFPDLHNLRTT